MTEPIKIEVHATTYPNDNTEFSHKYRNDLLYIFELSEKQLNDVLGEVSNNIIVDDTNPFSLVAIATFDDADDTNPDIDYSVRDDSRAPDVIRAEDDDNRDDDEPEVAETENVLVIDNTDD
jgi:hypothetical protein